MDFGAVICKPAAPLCLSCPFRSDCIAFNENRISTLPIKSKKTAVRKRWFYYFILTHDDKFAIYKRTGKDIWQDLYEYPLIETEAEKTSAQLFKMAEDKGWLSHSDKKTTVSGVFRQQLSHQLITGRFIHITLLNKPAHSTNWIWIDPTTRADYPFPQFINQYVAG
jgi:A/G-specific adenine glycosylase